MKRGYIHILKGKSKKARYIPLTERAQQCLLEQKKYSKSEYVFVGKDGVRPASRYTVSEQFRDCRNELGWPWDAVLHSTRHTTLTTLGEEMGEFSLMQIAGHEQISTTQRYVHPLTETLERAADILEAAAKPKKNVNRGAKKPSTKTATTHNMFVHTVQQVQ